MRSFLRQPSSDTVKQQRRGKPRTAQPTHSVGLTMLALVSLLVVVGSSPAAEISIVHSFPRSLTDTWSPAGLATDGSTIYGVTVEHARLYSVNPDGSNYQELLNFRDNNLGTPSGEGTLTLSNGRIYVATHLSDRVFGVDTDGTNLQVLHNFAGATEGTSPTGAPVLSGTTLYGSTLYGGPNEHGTIYSMNTDGSNFQVLYDFPGATAPRLNGIPMVVGSRLYGTSALGGANDLGTIYSMNLDGTDFQIIHTFDNTVTGAYARPELAVIGSKLYGATWLVSGSHDAGTLFSMDLDGSNYQILHDFTGPPDGRGPRALTVVGSQLYGVTFYGGDISDNGSVFVINADGSGYEVLDRISNGISRPKTRLVSVGSTLLGTTSASGTVDGGVLFSILVPEPSSVLLLAMGIGSILLMRLRKKTNET